MNRLKPNIDNALRALARMQQTNGSFPLYMRVPPSKWRPCSPLFSTAYIMISGGQYLAQDSVARALDYLRRQRRADGLWEYDPDLGVPPDADDTACALAALAPHDSELDRKFGAELLRSFWDPARNHFRSWNVAPPWSLPERDDPVVNCNILYALQCLGSPPTDKELELVGRFISQSTQGTRYYYSDSTITHAARRARLDERYLPECARRRPEAEKLLAAMQWLCGMRVEDNNILQQVLSSQQTNGSWPVRPWVTAAGNPPPLWGSPAITTAIAIEALMHYPKTE